MNNKIYSRKNETQDTFKINLDAKSLIKLTNVDIYKIFSANMRNYKIILQFVSIFRNFL